MKIGYPAKNIALKAFLEDEMKVISFESDKIKQIVFNNLEKLEKVLRFNVGSNLLLYRLPPQLIPYASSAKNEFDWQDTFRKKFEYLGEFIRRNNIRISIHAELYTLLNTKEKRALENSLKDLRYMTRLLEAFSLGPEAKIQLHIGDVGKSKKDSMRFFIDNINSLDNSIKERIAIENDCVVFTLKDCLAVSRETGIPVIFDYLHHQVKGDGESVPEAMARVCETWKPQDGATTVDYSSQKRGKMPGKHADSIDMDDFEKFLSETEGYDFDLMIEIKDMERSAQKAFIKLKDDPRIIKSASVF